MFADHIFVIAASMSRHSRYDHLDDRLLADIGMTRAEFIKQTRRFGRKSAAR